MVLKKKIFGMINLTKILNLKRAIILKNKLNSYVLLSVDGGNDDKQVL